jgi:hypothetical protein
MSEAGERGASEQGRLTDRFGLLLILLIVAIVSLAAAGDSGLGQIIAVTAMGGSAIVALAVSGVSGTRFRLALGLVILVAVAAATFAGVQDEGGVPGAAGMGFMAVIAILAILRRVRSYDRVTLPTVLAAIGVYLFVGMFFASVYAGVGAVMDTGFFAQEATPNAANYVYYSFITMTTVGYGDLTPAGDLGRMLAATEALLGQIYLVTVVALLVSNIGRGRRPRLDDDEARS